MSTCADLEDWVANYVEGSLPLPTRRELARHLDECGGCRELLAAYERTVWVAKKALQCSSYPAQAPEQLVQTILGSLRRRPFCR
jgi:anti-sigma factor RsiW